MTDKLEGKVALVTGGTKGIGFAIAQAFINEGASVAISGRTQKTGEEAATRLGGHACFVPCDVTDPESIRSMVAAAIEKFGKVDILVNNAGGATEFAPLMEMDDDTWQSIIDLNLTAAFRVSRAVFPGMAERKWGRIINISSVEGKHPTPGLGHYVSAKHGLHGFTKVLSKEVGPLGITVNAICPGLVITDMIKDNVAKAAEASGTDVETFLQGYASHSALGRPNEPEEVAAMAVLVASEEGAGITGAALSVDAGTAAY